jgi:hypothetical protein
LTSEGIDPVKLLSSNEIVESELGNSFICPMSDDRVVFSIAKYESEDIPDREDKFPVKGKPTNCKLSS